MDKRLVLATALAMSAPMEAANKSVPLLRDHERQPSLEGFGGSRKDRREHSKGHGFTLGNKYQSKTKRRAKIAKASRQFNRRKAKGMRV